MSTAANALVAQALKVMNADPAQAETLLRAALQADPRNDDAQLVLSEALRRQAKLADARQFAQAQVQIRPQWFGAQRQLGVVLADLREPLPAAVALQRAATAVRDWAEPT